MHNPLVLRSRATSSRNGGLMPAVYRKLKLVFETVDSRLRNCDYFHFVDCRRDARLLVCLLVSDQAELWPHVIPRFEAALPDADVCVVSQGMHSEYLEGLCASKAWSYLWTTTDDTSLAQNICYGLHPAAQLIIKVDDNVFVVRDTLRSLVDEHHRFKSDGVIDPGFLAPVSPLNGACYRLVLDRLGCLEEYEARFGRARLASVGTALQNDPAAAQWIWERTIPLERTAARMASSAQDHVLSPIQFNTGLILFERAFWQEFGHFPVYRRRLVAGFCTDGLDEFHFCTRSISASRPMVITMRSFAARFAHCGQYEGMRATMLVRPQLFN